MAIVEEIIIQGDSSDAEAAWKRTAAASEQATAKMSSHAQRVQEAWRRVEAQRVKDAMAEVQRMNQADELQKKLQKKFGETAFGMLAVGAAIHEVGRAADVALKMMADRLAPKNELGMALTATEQKFMSIKQVIDDTNLTKVEKLFAMAFAAMGSDTAGAFARMDMQDAAVRARERDRAASDALIQEEMAKSGAGSTNLIAASGLSKKWTESAKEKRLKRTEKTQDFSEDRARIVSDMDDRIAAMHDDIASSNLDRQIDLTNKIVELDEERAEEREKIAKEETEAIARQWETLAEVGASVASNMTATAVESMFAWADGQKPALDQIADQFLEANGKMLVSRGIMDVLIGGARTLTGDPTGAALASIGAVEIGAGAAMMGGALVIPGKGNQGGGRGGGGSSGGGSRDFSGGGGRRGASDMGGDGVIIINVNGVLASKDAGRDIEEAIARSRRRYRR